jgi:hypothetical protein
MLAMMPTDRTELLQDAPLALPIGMPITVSRRRFERALLPPV